ncbi:MAG: RNA methyltransferase [Clostridiales bacterium]|nr:RNA methyltransferase [Clostridiales bacterium]
MQRAENNLIKKLKLAKREDHSLLFLDNFKIIKDALNGGLEAKYIFLTNEEDNIFDDMDCPIYKVDKSVIEQLSDSKTPQGVVCIAEYTPHIVEKPKTNFLVLDRLQDPGNVGTLIRTACACGFEYVYLLDSVKPTNSKLIRSTVGTIFNEKVISLSVDDFIKKAQEWDLNLLVADMDGENIFEFNCAEQIGLIVGNEGQGVCDELIKICSHKVRIPMKEGVESLNAGISGGIIMYQLAKNNLS